MSETKSEGMIIHPSGRRSNVNESEPILLNDIPLKIVDSFKYLGVGLSSELKRGEHLAATEEKARLARIETVNLVKLLEVKDPKKLKLYLLSSVESQFYGKELLPVKCEASMKSIGCLFLSSLVDLTKSFPSCVVNFLLNLTPVAVTMLKSQMSLYQRLCGHDVPLAPRCNTIGEGSLVAKTRGMASRFVFYFPSDQSKCKILGFLLGM